MNALNLSQLEVLRALKGCPVVAYPGGDYDVKEVTRVFEVLKSAPREAFLSHEGYDEEFAGTQLVEHRELRSDHIYREVYQRWITIPGVPTQNTSVGGDWRQQFAKDGEVITETQPVGSDLSQLEDGSDVVSGQINQTDKNQGTITVNKAPGGFVDLEGKAYNAPGWAKFAKDGIIVTTRSLGSHGDAPDTGLNVIQSEVSPQNDVDAIKTTQSAEELEDVENFNLIDGAAMGARTKEIISPVEPDDPYPTLDFKTISAERKKVESGKSEQSIVTLDEAAYPILYGSKVDEATGITVDFEKKFVANGTAGGVSGSTYTDIQTYNKLRSISIASKVRSLPSSEDIPIFVNVSLPSELQKVEIIWDSQKTKGESASLDGAGASARVVVNGVIAVTTKDGYRGPIRGTLTRTYHSSVPTAPTATKIVPSSGMAYLIHKFSSQNNSISASSVSISSGAGVRTNVTRISGVLTNGIGLTGTSSFNDDESASATTSGATVVLTANAQASCEGVAVLEMPSSSPASLSGATVVHAVNISRWRLGIWVREVIEITFPSY